MCMLVLHFLVHLMILLKSVNQQQLLVLFGII